MSDLKIFILVFYAFSTAFILEWNPHIVIMTTMGVFILFKGIEVIFQENFATEFAIKIGNYSIRLNNLGLVLLFISIFLLLFPFSNQTIVNLKKIDAIFGYSKIDAKLLDGKWKINKVLYRGFPLPMYKYISGEMEFTSYDNDRGAFQINLEILTDNNEKKNVRLKYPFHTSFSHLVINDDQAYGEGISGDSLDEFYEEYFCNNKIEIVRINNETTLRSYWEDCDEASSDTFQIEALHLDSLKQ